SYNLKGTIYHEDFKGYKGILQAGDCQWATLGRAIVHAQMPGSLEEESEGFQLWINLPMKEKMCEPQYQEITKDNIPKAEKNGTSVKIIAGESLGVKGPFYHRTPTIYLDVHM